jgi:hypothetical protein
MEKAMSNQQIEKVYYHNGNICSELYYENGISHREDGPSCIYYYRDGNIRYKIYSIKGKRHREDGPAYTYYHENGNVQYAEYWLDNRVISREEWWKQLSSKQRIGTLYMLDE